MSKKYNLEKQTLIDNLGNTCISVRFICPINPWLRNRQNGCDVIFTFDRKSKEGQCDVYLLYFRLVHNSI